MLEASALLIGTQIGAGILGLPFALKDLGILGIVLIAVVGCLTLVTAMVVLRLSEKFHGSLSEVTQACLGKAGAAVMLISISILIYGAMIAYIASSGQLIEKLFGFQSQISSYVFWAIFSLVVLFGIKLSGEVELGLNFILMLALLAGAFMVFPKFNPQNLAIKDPGKLTGGVGVVAFAYVSHMLVPEILRGMGDFKRAALSVKLGFFVPMFFYSIFALAFVGALGSNTPEIVTTILEERGSFGKVVGILLPLSAIGTSYIGVSFAQMRNIEGLFKINRMWSWVLTVFPPLVIYLCGLKSFVKALWLGGTFGGIIYAGILPVLMYMKCCDNKGFWKSFAVYASGGIFALVLVATFAELFKSF